MPPTLVTGSAIGNGISQEDTFIEGAPYIYIQDYTAMPLNNPDSDGYHWGITGTTLYPYYVLGCVSNVSLTEGVTMNDVMCDTVGTKDTIQKRDYIELSLEISSIFPLTSASLVMNLSTAVVANGIEKVGIGAINNQRKFMVYMPKVYDEDTGKYIFVHLHKAKFVDAWTIPMTSGEPWKVQGVKIRAYADDTKKAQERFGVFLRNQS
jgi:hypothetical protein